MPDAQSGRQDVYRQFVGARSSVTSSSTVEGLAAVRDDPTARRLMGDPYALSPNRAAEPDLGRQPTRTSFDYDAELGTWLGPFWYERLHGQVVRRTNALLGYPYGRQFRYQEAVALGTGLNALVGRARTLAEIGWVPLALHPRTGRVVEAQVRRRAPAPRSGPAEGRPPDKPSCSSGSKARASSSTPSRPAGAFGRPDTALPVSPDPGRSSRQPATAALAGGLRYRDVLTQRSEGEGRE